MTMLMMAFVNLTTTIKCSWPIAIYIFLLVCYSIVHVNVNTKYIVKIHHCLLVFKGRARVSLKLFEPSTKWQMSYKLKCI